MSFAVHKSAVGTYRCGCKGGPGRRGGFVRGPAFVGRRAFVLLTNAQLREAVQQSQGTGDA